MSWNHDLSLFQHFLGIISMLQTIFGATFTVCQMLVWESNSHFWFWHFQRICGKVHWTIFKLLSKRFPRMDPPEVEQNVSCKEKKRVPVKNTPFRNSWWEKPTPIFVRTWSERALKIGSKNCFKHHTWSVCNYKFPQFGFNKTSLRVSWRRKTVWVSNLQLLFPKISFSTSKECTQVFETIKFPSEYPQKTQLNIRCFISYLENVFPDVILLKRGKKLFMSNLFFQHS